MSIESIPEVPSFSRGGRFTVDRNRFELYQVAETAEN